MASGDLASTGSNRPGSAVNAPELRPFVMGLFFIFGGITSLNDVIIPRLKELFTLTYPQAMLIQFCFGAINILGSLASLHAASLSGAALDACRTEKTAAIVRAYMGLSAALAIVAAVVWLFRDRLP